MDFKRIGLILATSIVGLILWTKWHQEYPTLPPNHSSPTTAKQNSHQPQSGGGKATGKGKPHAGGKHGVNPPSPGVVKLKTDTLALNIDLQGATISQADLRKYSNSLSDPTSVDILHNNYALKNSINGSFDVKGNLNPVNAIYRVKHQDKNSLLLEANPAKGLVIDKQYSFTPGSYSVKIATTVHNNSTSPWVAQFSHSIQRDNPGKSQHFNGASYSTATDAYEKLSYSDMDKSDLAVKSKDGWVAMQQHYFLSAWVPQQNTIQQLFSKTSAYRGSTLYNIGALSKPFTIAAHSSHVYTSQFYVGPENTIALKALAKNLDLTVNYGWPSIISKFLFWVMNGIHSVVGNWGWSIILITVLIKIVLYYPSAKSYRSMARMRDVAPKMKILQERHKDDRQALSQASMALYKKEKVNPLGGCLPILIQLPIFIALYHLLGASVELRQAPFVLWIKDLSVKDPYYVLPVLMGASMFLQQMVSPKPADPTQAKMMMLLPVGMTIFFMSFPAGLVLYWLTNNLISVAQQTFIMKTFNVKEADKKKRYKERDKRKRKSKT